MKKVKYVIFDECFPVIFNVALNHNDILCKGRKPTSAGFFDIQYNSKEDKYYPKCYGESTSLGIKSDPNNDERMINLTINSYF